MPLLRATNAVNPLRDVAPHMSQINTGKVILIFQALFLYFRFRVQMFTGYFEVPAWGRCRTGTIPGQAPVQIATCIWLAAGDVYLQLKKPVLTLKRRSPAS